MSTEDNKAIIRRLYDEIHSKGNWAAVDELVGTNFVDHNPPAPDFPSGPEGVKQTLGMFRSALPDMHVTVEDIIAEGDKVAARITMSGTHRGELMGVAPTGKQITLGLIDITRLADGKIVERWGEGDMLGMMQQLGVVPPPG